MTSQRDTPRQRAFGRAVREVRARRGLSQEALGQGSGLHRNYIGAIERGEICPTLGTLDKLAIGLDLSLPTLLTIYERNVSELNDSAER